MPVFKYQGYNEAGAEVSGTIDAENLREAIIKIKEQGIFPGEILEEGLYKKGFLFRRLSISVLPEVTRRLSTLLSSGVSVIDALNAISSEQKGVWRNILVDIKERVSGGSSLSKAMQSYPDVFPDFYVGMASAGESSGDLSNVLNTLADFLETQMNIRGKVRTAMIYPLFMGVVSVIVLSFLFIFVVPKITTMFEDTSATLPAITIVLIYVSTAFRNYWWLMILFLALFAGLYRWIRKKRRVLIDQFLIKEPTGIMKTLYMLRFTATMSFLLHGGLPMLNALKLTSKATGNLFIERKIMSAYELVSQGASLSNSLEDFPPTLLQIISTGEKSGRLSEALKRVADSYEKEFDRKLQRAMGLLEPSLILIMGFIVGFIVLAVLLPIFELNQLIR
jgi:general secretion pathway protein F